MREWFHRVARLPTNIRKMEIGLAPDLPIKLYCSYKRIFFNRTISRTPVANSSFNEQSIMRMRTHSRTGLGGVI